MAVLAQHASGAITTGTTCTATLAATPASGNLLVASVFTRSANLTNPVNWTTAVDVVNATDNDVHRIAFRTAGASEPAAVTFTNDEGFATIVGAMEFNGAQASPMDQTASTGRTSAASISTGTTATTTTTDAIAVASVGARDLSNEAVTWTNAFTGLHAVNDGTNLAQLYDAYRSLTAVGTYETTATWTTSAVSLAAIAIFKVEGGGAAGRVILRGVGRGIYRMAA